ncbi:MAG: MBL fold metallo-hydrolase [Promethearchaeati archaeon SRVP18_Atabeyarchaeia-1]
MPHEEITPSLIRVYGKYDEDGIANSSYVIIDEKVAAVDTGAKGELWKEVIDVVKNHGRDPKKDLRYVLLTHEHPDHFGAAAELKNASNAKIYVHSAAADTLRDPAKLLVEHFNPSEESNGIAHKLQGIFGRIDPVNPDSILLGGERIELGRSTLTVIHSGGHCGGHVMFYDDYRRVMFTGDETIESPSNPCKYIIDMTGSVERKAIILKRLLELRIDFLAPAHDSLASGDMIKEQISRAIDAHEMWMSEVSDTVSRLGEADTKEIADSVERALGLGWSGELKPVATALTTAAYLRSLSARGVLQQSEEEKGGRKIWTAR